MRVGVIADIHGNLFALEAVLAALEREGVDRLVCLGDVAASGPRPVEVIARLRALDCPTVLGNADAWLLGDDGPNPAGTDVQQLLDQIAWASGLLSAADREYLRAAPLERELPLAGATTLRYFHGSPRSYDEIIAAGTPPDDLAAMFGGRQTAFLAGGHTHRQLVRRDGESLFINPGSVGLPGVGPNHPLIAFNRRVTWAEYGVLESGPAGMGVSLRRIPLDLDRLFADARDSGMPHVDWWLDLWARG